MFIHIRFLVIGTILTAVTSLHAQATEPSTRAVIRALESKDCVAAVRELNGVLAGAVPEAFLLGGAMFEQGLCLKQSTERAAKLYLRAAEASVAGAQAHLAALYASTANVEDKGAAIWWGLQATLPLPASCVVPAALRSNAEGFAKALVDWPAGQLEACVYVTGILAALDKEFVVKPAASAGDGISVRFVPSTGKLEASFAQRSFERNEGLPRVVTGSDGVQSMQSFGPDQTSDHLQALQIQGAQRELALHVERTGAQAMQRAARPALIDKNWLIELRIEAARSR